MFILVFLIPLSFTRHRAGTFGAILEYGAEKKLSQNSALSASLGVGVPTGVQLKIK